MRAARYLCSVMIVLPAAAAVAQDATIDVDASKTVCRLTDMMTGANLEDLNYQLTGGLYSQLIHGESFEAPGAAGVSRQWRPVRRGKAAGSFALARNGTFNGRHSQSVAFTGGDGEIGVDNMGLNRWGINVVAGKPYEGLLRIRTPKAATVFVSLVSADGSRRLAEKALATAGDAKTWQRMTFTLTPTASDTGGRFAVTLKQPGTMTLGYVFLQPGPWGRFKGLPVRKDLAEALVNQGVKVVRFCGSMINPAEYRWKNMIGPRDERPPYKGAFNPHAGFGFAIIECLAFCEAAEMVAVPGLNIAESAQDFADFVEYVNGPADSPWGRRRAADGHPAPFNLKYIGIGNEHKINAEYAAYFKRAATAIWSKDPNITLLVGDWMYRNPMPDPGNIRGARIGNLKGHLEIINWCVQQGKGDKLWWDIHVWERGPHDADRPIGGVIGMRDLYGHLRKLAPNWKPQLAALEENAGNHDMTRAIAHAHMKNTLERMGGYVPAVAAPNTFQPWKQYTTPMWDQGLIFYTPTQVWYQPAAYVDRMITRNWVRNVVPAAVACPGNAMDVTAKKSDDGKRLTLQVVNISSKPLTATLTLKGFAPKKPVARREQLTGKPGDTNTPDAPRKIRPVVTQWAHGLAGGRTTCTFPAFSFTVIVLE